jgi:orotate phosphoribosyltransferase
LTFGLIGALFWQKIKYLGVDGVAGMSVGADPIVCSILAKANEEDIPLEGILVRKETKKYGTQRQIEGNVREGMDIVLVEDVVTTGGSVLKAAEILEKEKLQIIKIFALIDREEGGKENIEAKGYEFESFFTLKEILKKHQELSSKNA